MPAEAGGKINRCIPRSQGEDLIPAQDKQDDHQRMTSSVASHKYGLRAICPVRRHDNFFEIGGQSLEGVGVLSAIDQEFSHPLCAGGMVTP